MILLRILSSLLDVKFFVTFEPYRNLKDRLLWAKVRVKVFVLSEPDEGVILKNEVPRRHSS